MTELTPYTGGVIQDTSLQPYTGGVVKDSAPQGEDYFPDALKIERKQPIVAPSKQKPMTPDERKEMFRQRREDTETLKEGLVAGAKKNVAGAGELVGLVGEYTGLPELEEKVGRPSAEWAKELETKGTPGSRLTGELIGFGAAGKVLGTASRLLRGAPEILPAAEEFATKGKQIWEGIKAGTKGGATYGALSATGEEDVGDRLRSKALSTALGTAGGAVLGGGTAAIFAKTPPTASSVARQWAKELIGPEGLPRLEALAREGDAALKAAEAEFSRLSKIKLPTEKEVTEATEAAIEARHNNLLGEIDKHTTTILNAAREKADMLRQAGGANAEAAAKQVMDAAEAQVRYARGKANDFIDRANSYVNQIKSGISNIGERKELTDVFTPVREKAVSGQNKLIEERNALDETLRTAQQDIVKANEKAGVTIEQTPSFQTLKQQVAAFDPVTSPQIVQNTDPGKLALYKRLRDSLFTKTYELSPEQAEKALALKRPVKEVIGEDGNARYFRTFNSSFEALDDARRFLGESFTKDIAGYEGISTIEKQNLYKLLSNIQEEYVGASEQKALQSNWANAQQKLDVFNTKAGSALTELQEKSTDFARDASQLGKTFFGNKEGVDRLITLTGDTNLVTQTARNYFRNLVEGKTSSQVNQVLNTPAMRDVLSHPNLQQIGADLQGYQTRLARAEAVEAAKTKYGQAPIKTETGGREGTLPFQARQAKEAEKVRAGILKGAETEAGKVESEAVKEAKSVISVQEQAKANEVKALIQDVDARTKAALDKIQTVPDYAEKIRKLRNLAETTIKAEEQAAASGMSATKLNYNNLVNETKNFLADQVKNGVLPQDIALKELQKIDRIAESLSGELKAQLLREELAVLGGQLASFRLKGALKTGAGILGNL